MVSTWEPSQPLIRVRLQPRKNTSLGPAIARAIQPFDRALQSALRPPSPDAACERWRGGIGTGAREGEGGRCIGYRGAAFTAERRQWADVALTGERQRWHGKGNVNRGEATLAGERQYWHYWADGVRGESEGVLVMS